MIGTVLIVVGLFALLSSSIRLAGLQRLDTEVGLAYAACKNSLEELRVVSGAALPALHGTGFGVFAPDGVTLALRPVPGDPDGLPGEIAVSLDQTAAGATLYRIEASVTWAGSSGRHECRLSTLRRGGP